MFFNKLKKNRNEQNIKYVHIRETVESGNDNKSSYYKDIAQNLNMIDLEKEMQSGLDLLL